MRIQDFSSYTDCPNTDGDVPDDGDPDHKPESAVTVAPRCSWWLTRGCVRT
jgi:hypothetical protein